MKGTDNIQENNSRHKIIRHVFRLPVTENDSVSLTIKNQPFKVLNIGSNGVSILLNEDCFEVGQQLDSIELVLDNDTFPLIGKIIHISPRDFQLIAGIEFLNLGEKIENKFLNFLRKNRDNLFSER